MLFGNEKSKRDLVSIEEDSLIEEDMLLLIVMPYSATSDRAYSISTHPHATTNKALLSH